MKIVHTKPEKSHYVWPPRPGKVYSIPVDEALKIGDGFTWETEAGSAQMQVIGLDMRPDEKRVFAVVD